jgi:serine/threonine protein phosphatase PrpC
MRDGRVEPVSLQADPPFGTVPGHRYRVQRLPLEPGGRLLFFTDGIIARNTTDVDVEAMLAASAQMHPREAVQHLIQAILRATNGALNDDADRLVPRLAWRAGAGANDRLRRKRVRGERKSLAPIRFGVV